MTADKCAHPGVCYMPCLAMSIRSNLSEATAKTLMRKSSNGELVPCEIAPGTLVGLPESCCHAALKKTMVFPSLHDKAVELLSPPRQKDLRSTVGVPGLDAWGMQRSYR